VPGSETAKKIASAPAVDTKAIDIPVAVEVPIDPAAMAVGKTQYLVCAACHGQNGEGGPIAPPLAGSEWVNGPISNLIRIQLRGLQGPISVKGTEYNMPGGMAPLAYQTDEQVAGVITYIRNSFGNKASAAKAEQVAALRSEVGKPQVTAAELTQP
jgi:mono/diheme cytochrome c family protein